LGKNGINHDPESRLRNHQKRQIIKELVDNALDSGRNVEIGWVEGPSDLCSFFVEDDGEGIPGDDDDLAELFSIRRPLTTSKQKRMPTRGMLGNGLRVVVGVVLCSKGVLRVSTKGRTLTLQPEMEEGSTAIVDRQSWQGKGTRIEVELTGDLANVAMEGDLFDWGEQALILNRGERYKGKTSPWWYGSHSFWELLQAAGRDPSNEWFLNSMDARNVAGLPMWLESWLIEVAAQSLNWRPPSFSNGHEATPSQFQRNDWGRSGNCPACLDMPEHEMFSSVMTERRYHTWLKRGLLEVGKRN